jgi:hypothetical protein
VLDELLEQFQRDLGGAPGLLERDVVRRSQLAQFRDRGVEVDRGPDRFGKSPVQRHRAPLAAEVVLGSVSVPDDLGTEHRLCALDYQTLCESGDVVVGAIGLIGLQHGELG